MLERTVERSASPVFVRGDAGCGLWWLEFRRSELRKRGKLALCMFSKGEQAVTDILRSTGDRATSPPAISRRRPTRREQQVLFAVDCVSHGSAPRRFARRRTKR